MKKKAFRKSESGTKTMELVQVIVPLNEQSGDCGLFDDCPLCQELKEMERLGLVTEIPIQVEVEK